MDKPFQYQFEWDAAKARQNARKHRVTFERGATIFSDQNALSLFDEEHSQDEDRCVTLGLDRTGTLLVVCHTLIGRKRKPAQDYALSWYAKRQRTKRNNMRGNRL